MRVSEICEANYSRFEAKTAGAVAAPVALATGIAGCDPVINVAGANFPAWLLCVLAGIAVAAVLRQVLIAARLDTYLGPPSVIYTSLAIMAALIVWIIFFNRI